MIGYWGVYDTNTEETETMGEMYSFNGEWIPGPEIKELIRLDEELSWKGSTCC